MNISNRSIVFLLLFGLTSIANELPKKQIGVSFYTGNIHSIGFISSISDKLFARFAINFNYKSEEREIWDYGIETVVNYDIGCNGSLFYTFFDKLKSQFYIGPEIGMIRSYEEVPVLYVTRSYTYSNYGMLIHMKMIFFLNLTLGASYYFTNHFGVFGEFGLGPYYSISSFENGDMGNVWGFEMNNTKIGFNLIF